MLITCLLEPYKISDIGFDASRAESGVLSKETLQRLLMNSVDQEGELVQRINVHARNYRSQHLGS